PVADSVGRFLAAYLLGDGELTRYVSPGSALSPISPPPYTELVLRDLFPDESSSAGPSGGRERGGPRRGVLATVDATDRYATTRQLSYALTLTSRDGRWEVSALDPAPALATGDGIPHATSTTAPQAPEHVQP